MPANKHPAYREELERCRYTLEYVHKTLKSVSEKKDYLAREVNRIQKHFNAENSQDYIDLGVNTLLLSSFSLKLRNLITATSKPYFARIDFIEDSSDKCEKLYIGKISLMRDEDQKVIIVDWRAPIANLYYEGRLGKASYQCPDGNIQGELKLKRQFAINGGELQEIFDIDITTNDEFLQTYLGANADNRLKEIVSTIQEEQNRIIRADMWRPLIVQGVAGSGKTTIALHRIAYLIYTYEKQFKPENFMIIAPNRLFLNYISEVLPELGVERVKQTTFEDFAMELIGKRLKIRDANEKLMMFANHNISAEQAENNELLRKSSELKTSMIFKDIIDDYIRLIEEDFIPREDFKIGSGTIYTYEEINDLFIREYRNWPLVKRLDEIRKHLHNRLKQKKEVIANEYHEQCDREVFRLKMEMPEGDERQALIIKAFDTRNEKIRMLESNAKKAAKDYISRISKLNPVQYYKDLMSDPATFRKVFEGKAEEEVLEYLRTYTNRVLNSGYVDIEDLAPIIYLKYRIYGMDEKIPVKHIVIDEAQDFSAFQFLVIRRIVKDSSFTILGDLAQGIHSYRGTRDWDEIRDLVFDDCKVQLLKLEQSYRTTVEIMDAANKVLERLKVRHIFKAKPVIRHGDTVKIEKKKDMAEIAEGMRQRIEKLRSEKYKSIAVICKTMEECMEVYSYLKKLKEPPYVITGKEAEYKSGLVIVPSYLSKGLEFDVVMIANASSEQYCDEETDIKLLYVSMTRALHKLIIYYHGQQSPLLEGL